MLPRIIPYHARRTYVAARKPAAECKVLSIRKTGENDYNVYYDVEFIVDGRRHTITLEYMKSGRRLFLITGIARSQEDMEAYCKCMNEILREARRVVG